MKCLFCKFERMTMPICPTCFDMYSTRERAESTEIVRAAIEYFRNPLIHINYMKLKQATESHPGWESTPEKETKMKYGEPIDVLGECNAHLYIGDNFGDNHATMRCKLPKGHEGEHKEEYLSGGEPVVVIWLENERDYKDNPEEETE